jgi:ribose-phosphate pyrophosphokinase
VDVVACSNSQGLAARLARILGARLVLVERRVFPDGELYVRIQDEPGAEAIVVQSMSPRPNDALAELILVAETLRDLGARRVHGVIPYLAYMRQDSRFKPGEAVSAEIMGRLISRLGFDKIVTVDMHLHRIKDPAAILGKGARNLSASGLLAGHISQTYDLRDPLVIGPDEEAEQWARIAAESINAEYTVFEKERLGPEEVSLKPRGLRDLDGRDVIVIDDIISTGGTMAGAVAEAYRHGARRVFAAATHAVLAPGALGKIYSAGALDVIATDTIESPVTRVSVAELIAKKFE